MKVASWLLVLPEPFAGVAWYLWGAELALAGLLFVGVVRFVAASLLLSEAS